MIGNLAATLLAVFLCAPALARAETAGDASPAGPTPVGNASVNPASASAEIRRAAGLYHRGKFDSAFAVLHELEGTGPWKRRDSLAWLQYSGMSSARLGHDSAATAFFSGLLSQDSQFQFPRNEDALVMAAFRGAENPGARITQDSAVDSIQGAALASQADSPPPPEKPISLVFQSQVHAEPKAQDAGRTQGANASRPAAAGETNRFDRSGHRVGFAYGALPFGTGWVSRGKVKSGIAFGILEFGGIAFSIFASEMQTRMENREYGVPDQRELSGQNGWQWTQRATLSTALGAYLFSILAASGD